MNKWAQRLALEFPARSAQATDETDETGVVSVLAVPYGQVAQISGGEPRGAPDTCSGPSARPTPAPPAGSVTAVVLGLDTEARALLDVLLAIYPDTGAVPTKELAQAARLPLGLVLSALSLLQAAGAVVQQGREWAPSRRLRGELQAEGRVQVC